MFWSCLLIPVITACLYSLDVANPSRYVQSTQESSLAGGSRTERQMSGGETHRYQIKLSKGQFLHVIVTQQGIDVVVALVGPAGERLAEVDSPNEAYGPEPISMIAEADGAYLLEVRSPNRQAGPGKYLVEVKHLRDSEEGDRARVSAQQLFMEGRRLRAKNDAASLRAAIKKFEEAVVLYQSFGETDREGQTLNLIGYVYALLSEHRKAIGYYSQALTRFRDNNDRPMQAVVLGNIGGAYGELAEWQKALTYYKGALEIRRETGHRVGEALMLNNMGGVYLRQNEFQKALDAQSEALAINRAARNESREAYTMYTQASIYVALGDFQNALSLNLKSLEIFKRLGDTRGEAATRDGIAAAYLQMEEPDPEQAIQFLKESLEIWRKRGERGQEAFTLNNLGRAQLQLGHADAALEFYSRALELRRSVEDRLGEATALASIGQAYGALGDHKKALDCYKQALAMQKSLADRKGQAASLSGIAQEERELGNLEAAQLSIDEAVGIIDNFRVSLNSRDNRAGLVASNRSYYEFQIDLLMRLHERDHSRGYDVAALQASERARSRSLLDALSEAGVGIRQGVDPELLDRERALLERLNDKEQYRIRLLARRAGAEQMAEIEREISELSAQYREVQGEITVKSPRYASLVQSQPLTVAGIQKQLLDDDTLLLEYALGEQASVLWVVGPGSVRSFKLPKRAEIESKARIVYESLTARNARVKFETPVERRTRIAQADAKLAEASADLSRILLGPAASELSNKRLLIVAEGLLQYLPFGALPAPSSAKVAAAEAQNGRGDPIAGEKPMIVDHEIISLPSASALEVLRKDFYERKPAEKVLAIFADPVFEKDDPRVRNADQPTQPNRPAVSRGASPVFGTETSASRKYERLPFTRREADAIAALVPNNQELKVLDFAASRSLALSPEMSKYRIVHFATHGFLNSKQPGLSGIVLSLVDERGKEQAGYLYLNDVYNMSLHADLSVLSGCETGIGKDIRGEGLIGLTRGFMYAGSPRVVVSLWEVNDEATAELMRRFYLGMLGRTRLSPAAALRAAQVQMWKDARLRAPYYWSAFVLQGEFR